MNMETITLLNRVKKDETIFKNTQIYNPYYFYFKLKIKITFTR
jgi:hypothetical protein